jgi:hypothetical protein
VGRVGVDDDGRVGVMTVWESVGENVSVERVVGFLVVNVMFS